MLPVGRPIAPARVCFFAVANSFAASVRLRHQPWPKSFARTPNTAYFISKFGKTGPVKAPAGWILPFALPINASIFNRVGNGF